MLLKSSNNSLQKIEMKMTSKLHFFSNLSAFSNAEKSYPLEFQLHLQFHLRTTILADGFLTKKRFFKIQKGIQMQFVVIVLRFILRHLSLTNLSVNGFLGRLFIMSDSASSYASEIAGTYG